MCIRAAESDCRGLESIEDKVSMVVRNVVQASESNLMAWGVAVDLLQMAKRVGPQYEAAEHEDLSEEKGFSLDNVITDDRRGHRVHCRWHSGTLNESTNVGVKTGGSRVEGPKQCVLGSMVTGGKGHDVLPRFGPSRWR